MRASGLRRSPGTVKSQQTADFSGGLNRWTQHFCLCAMMAGGRLVRDCWPCGGSRPISATLFRQFLLRSGMCDNRGLAEMKFDSGAVPIRCTQFAFLDNCTLPAVNSKGPIAVANKAIRGSYLARCGEKLPGVCVAVAGA